MYRIFCLTTMMAVAMMMPSAALAQSRAAGSQINGVVVKGNTTTVFKAANDSDLPMGLLRRWNGFAQEHPEIARQLGNKPKLMDDAGYLRKHPELGKLFEDNPDLRSAMKRNPGNFVANLPRSEE